jgi:hypothetical protein
MEFHSAVAAWLDTGQGLAIGRCLCDLIQAVRPRTPLLSFPRLVMITATFPSGGHLSILCAAIDAYAVGPESIKVFHHL